MKFNTTSLTAAQRLVFSELSALLGFAEDISGKDIIVNVSGTQSESIKITFLNNSVDIYIKEERLFARALSLIKSSDMQAEISETAVYEKLEGFIDCSRNAVITVECFKDFARRFALMGYSGIQLYIEDTYQIDDNPYFGYLRGAYTEAELNKMDSYCKSFGIELIPCIQTLAHLGKALRWEAYFDYTDCDDILLVGDERTYTLIDNMLKATSRGLSTKRINISMDEAHLLGLGKYMQQHGITDRLQIMTEHLNRVIELAKKYGYTDIIMWSDMFFRLLNGGEYESNIELTPEQRAIIPKEVTMMYWNYYSTDKSIYDNMLQSHKKMSNRVAFAAGAWKFTSFAPHNSFSMLTGRLAHQSCIEHSIKYLLVTTWGDDGGEASMYSILPTLAMWAELCYKGDCSDKMLKARFKATQNELLDDFMAADMLIETPENPLPTHSMCGVYPNKYILFQDILYGLFDKHITSETAEHFDKAYYRLELAAKRSNAAKPMFKYLAQLAKVLSIKSTCGIELRKAYRENNKKKLKQLASKTLPSVVREINLFSKLYYDFWKTENKIFGFDMFDIKIGALKERINRAVSRVNEYLKGDIPAIEELEADILYYDCRSDDSDKPLGATEPFWLNIVSPSVCRRDTKY